MAGGGGGSWKVAYADFVTAMMAFFLVMWLVAQDQKTRQAVAQYFIDPTGASVKPGRQGAVFNDSSTGPIPKSESVAMGRGRQSHTRAESSAQTKMMADWLHSDGKAKQHWREQAGKARSDAPTSRDVRNKVCTEEEAAVSQLSKQLRDELTRNMPKGTSGIYQDLMFSALNEINFKELAQDLLSD